MKKKTWMRQHRWLGIAVSLFLMLFCVSGILLNHRGVIRKFSVSRRWLPSRYAYHDWNGGLLRGSVAVGDTVLVYGSGGVWRTNRQGSSFHDFNGGLPTDADDRQVRRLVLTRGGSLFAVTPYALYQYGGRGAWQDLKIPVDGTETLSDVEARGDTLVALSRDRLWISLPPYKTFHALELPPAPGADRRVTLFSTVWLLHSGSLFGMPGKIIADLVALVIMLLCVTGVAYWLKVWNRARLFSLHNTAGRYTIVLTLLIALTGWSLRPPVMILLAKCKVAALPGTAQKSGNPWHDKLRMVRYDSSCGDWLLSTSDGFYAVRDLPLRQSAGDKSATDNGSLQPVVVKGAPPANVMGLTVLEKDGSGRWLCGSMGGMTVWDRQTGSLTDYFTGQKPVTGKSPVGKHAIAGYSGDFRQPVIADYFGGTAIGKQQLGVSRQPLGFSRQQLGVSRQQLGVSRQQLGVLRQQLGVLRQPDALDNLPMSLWNFALEVHSGRIYAGNLGSFLFIFVIGVLVAWCLWSGYKLRK